MKLLLITILTISAFTCFSQDKLTSELDGTEITYQYSGGNQYHIKFQNGNISYQFLSGSKPGKWWGPFPYSATKTRASEYFLSWYEKGYGDHVTLLVNTANKSIWGSALIVKRDKHMLHFQKAKIKEFKR